MRASVRSALFGMVFGLSAMLGAAAQPTPPAGPCAYLASLVPEQVGPVFLPSYPTIATGPLHGAAFLYDNAAATLALIGCGEAGRARHIGDAILAALDHDRAWRDGRLRNAYAAGPVTAASVKLPGWWDDGQRRWLEDSYQVGSDTGNMAWAMLALLALDKAGFGPAYLDGARRIGLWAAARQDDRGAGGFTGGFLGWEPTPQPVAWKSTEHNTDLAAAFAQLAATTGEPVWSERAAAARAFVSAMWDPATGGYATGTGSDGVSRNPLLALDANVWPSFALPGEASARGTTVIASLDARLASADGYAYSEAGPGTWIEGTAQVALLQKLLGHEQAATRLNATVAAARAPVGGYFATGHTTLATGFADASNPKVERYYLHVPHLAAAAWAAMAVQGYNPFVAAARLP